MFCCRSHRDIGLLLEYSRGCQGICNHPPLLWIVNNIVTFKLCSQKFKPNQKILLKLQNGWFFNDSSKIVKKFSQMQNLGKLGPENCRAYMCFLHGVFFFFLLLLLFFSPFFPFFFLLIAWSKFAHILYKKLYSILHDFSFKNTKFSASERAHPPQTPPVCASMQLAWHSTKSSPSVEDGCTALCSFGVLAVVKCCKQCFYCNVFFFFFFSFLFLYINSRLFYLSLWKMKINLFTKFWGKLLTNKRNVFTWLEFIYTLMPHDLLKII